MNTISKKRNQFHVEHSNLFQEKARHNNFGKFEFIKEKYKDHYLKVHHEIEENKRNHFA